MMILSEVSVYNLLMVSVDAEPVEHYFTWPSSYLTQLSWLWVLG